MLSFDLRSLEAQAARVDGELAASDPIWEEGDPRPVEGVRVSGRLSQAGAGRFYFSGQLEGEASASCRRCLTEVRQKVSEEVHLLLVDGAADEADEADVYVIDARDRELDLRPAVREEWLLATPAFMVCSEDCKGLCPSCGANRNQEPCRCTPTVDPRWSALTSYTSNATQAP